MRVSVPPMGASGRRWLRADPADVAAWAVPALLIVFVGLSNGGYDPIARSAVGVAVWWTVLVGTALGLLPVAGGGRPARAMLIVAIAFAAWTALSVTWTDSDERTVTELARVSTYLAVFTLALAVQGEGRWRYILHGVTAGVAVVCALAVLSRMQPSWFPEEIAGRYLQGIQIQSRLAYPLNYPSGLGAFAAIGLPLALAGASTARSVAGQALAAAAIPVVALTLWLTTSSLSVPAAVIALAAFLVLAPDRLPKLATLAVAAGGTALLFVATEQRLAFDRGLPTQEAERQGDEMLALTLIVCAAVGLVQAALSHWLRRGRRPGWLRIPRPYAAVASAVTVGVLLIAAIAAGAPNRVEDEWNDFKGRTSANPEESRGTEILDFSGSGRYDFWEAAIDANGTDPWVGIGPGTFDFWWTEHGSYAAYVRDAHSLYLETLAELGIVGLLLVGALSAGILGIGAWRALRAPPDLRVGLAAATAGCAAFVAGALVDWTWELGVIPVVFFTLAAVACAAGAPTERAAARSAWVPPWRRHGPRIAICVLSILGLAAIVPPLWGAVKLEQSYDAVEEGRLGDALDDARGAASVQPYAASPRLQEALLLERRDRLDAALRAARDATQREPANWQLWLVRSRIAQRAGEQEEAASARERAQELNPRADIPAG
jgi:O-Antigen ligase